MKMRMRMKVRMRMKMRMRINMKIKVIRKSNIFFLFHSGFTYVFRFLAVDQQDFLKWANFGLEELP